MLAIKAWARNGVEPAALEALERALEEPGRDGAGAGPAPPPAGA